ncbi:hypothetical protein [Photorhabdus antumapuensis]|uniref:hypothetical protein n=1 Tax=Photorhabdus antumapuensis TaxID=2862867 RepID=UPI0030D7C7C2
MENNALAVPMPPPPIAGSNTDEAVNEANQTIASALDKKLKEIGETLDKATECSFGRVCSSDYVDGENQPNISKDLTDSEKAELGGSGAGTPGGWEPENEQRARNEELVKHQQQDRFNELTKVYDKHHPSQDLVIDSQTIRQGEGASRYGTTKIFESQKLTDKQIHNYAQQLAGDTPLKQVRSGIYTAKLGDGTTVTLRNVSTSEAQTGARWTIDVKDNGQLGDVATKYKTGIEIKFR